MSTSFLFFGKFSISQRHVLIDGLIDTGVYSVGYDMRRAMSKERTLLYA